MRHLAMLALVVASLVLAYPAGAASLSDIQSIKVGAKTRYFFYYKPRPFNPALGLVVWLHAGGSNAHEASAAATDDLWRLLADRIGLLVIFPEGKADANDPTKRTWNGCSDDTRTKAPDYDDLDDVAFLKALVPWAQKHIDAGIDTTRAYAGGHSEGALMAERLALEANDTFAAVASIAGSLPVSNDNSPTGAYTCQGYTSPWTPGTSQAVPMFLFKGNLDPRIPYGAASGPDATNYCQYKDQTRGYTTGYCPSGAVHSFYDTVAFWQWKLGISASPTVETAPTLTTPYADTVPSCTTSLASCDGSTVTRFVYGPSPARLVVEVAAGGGHPFPGPTEETRRQLKLEGWKNRDALGQPNPYVVEEMWAFLSQFTLAN